MEVPVTAEKDSIRITRKVIPESIKAEVLLALSYYPELKDVPIEFRYKRDIKKSFMQAQPRFSSLFRSRTNREYLILMSPEFNLEGQSYKIGELPQEVLIGWIGHELGHVMDYSNRSSLNLLWFGLRYITSDKYIKNAERAADVYAVQHGLADYILATKDFILNHAGISEKYRSRIIRLYLSPEEIMQMVKRINQPVK